MTACVSRAWAMDKYLEVQNLEWAAGFNEATASGAVTSRLPEAGPTYIWLLSRT